MAKRTERDHNTFQRLLWFFAKNITLIIVLLAILAMVFFVSMASANVGTVVSDGMHARAEVMIEGEDESTLNSYFSKNGIQTDTLRIEASDIYDNYLVSDLYYVAEHTSIICWPWMQSITVDVIESIPSITGTLTKENTGSGLSSTPPDWEDRVYTVHLAKIGGKWRIDGITLKQIQSKSDSADADVDTTAEPSVSASTE